MIKTYNNLWHYQSYKQRWLKKNTKTKTKKPHDAHSDVSMGQLHPSFPLSSSKVRRSCPTLALLGLQLHPDAPNTWEFPGELSILKAKTVSGNLERTGHPSFHFPLPSTWSTSPALTSATWQHQHTRLSCADRWRIADQRQERRSQEQRMPLMM